MSEPVPRPLPQIGGFSSPATELFNYTLWLRDHLDVVHRAMQTELGELPPERVPASLWETKLYATAVTLFAAAAVEAALNAYGLMRFGAEQFESHFAYAGPVKRLRSLLQYGPRLTLADDDPLLQAVTRLSRRRNTLVHQRAFESTVEDGVFRTPEAAWQVPDKIADADESLADMKIFFDRFPGLDPETATFLRPMLIPRPRPRGGLTRR